MDIIFFIAGILIMLKFSVSLSSAILFNRTSICAKGILIGYEKITGRNNYRTYIPIIEYNIGTKIKNFFEAEESFIIPYNIGDNVPILISKRNKSIAFLNNKNNYIMKYVHYAMSTIPVSLFFLYSHAIVSAIPITIITVSVFGILLTTAFRFMGFGSFFSRKSKIVKNLKYAEGIIMTSAELDKEKESSLLNYQSALIIGTIGFISIFGGYHFLPDSDYLDKEGISTIGEVVGVRRSTIKSKDGSYFYFPVVVYKGLDNISYKTTFKAAASFAPDPIGKKYEVMYSKENQSISKIVTHKRLLTSIVFTAYGFIFMFSGFMILKASKQK